MRKVANGRLGLVTALAASALGLAPAACNHAHFERTGIDLTVTVPADIKVKELTYQVIGNGIKPIVGTFRSAKPQQQYETLITRIPPGDDYHVAITAKSIDEKHSCSRELMVNVGKNAITRVHAALACKGGDGAIVISIGVACTKVQLATYTVSPLSASVGGTITMSANPLTDAGTLEYFWTASAGTFYDPEAEQTVYRCEKAGHIKVNLLVVAPDICLENHAIEIDCLAPSDGGTSDARGN